MLYPQIDTLEIQPSDFLVEQNLHESEFLFKNQAEPLQSSSFSIDSLEVSPESKLVPDIPVGEVIPSVDAVDWHKKGYNVDIRPRLVDSSSGEARLLDSGAQLSAAKKGPDDVLDESLFKCSSTTCLNTVPTSENWRSQMMQLSWPMYLLASAHLSSCPRCSSWMTPTLQYLQDLMLHFF